MKRKIISVLLAVMLLTAFLGCGEKEKSTEEKLLGAWKAEYVESQSGENRVLLSDILDETAVLVYTFYDDGEVEQNSNGRKVFMRWEFAEPDKVSILEYGVVVMCFKFDGTELIFDNIDTV